MLELVGEGGMGRGKEGVLGNRYQTDEKQWVLWREGACQGEGRVCCIMEADQYVSVRVGLGAGPFERGRGNGK